ncbi:EAL domain-containing protein [Marinomonas agarivorans]|nr:EAL domain-containing protein [Marinomonas agarivorans]
MSVSIEQLHTAVWIYDIDNFCINWANSAALKLWETDSLEELQSRDFLKDISDAVRTSLENYQQAFLQGEVVSEVWTLTPKGIAKEVFLIMSGHRLATGRMAMCCEAFEPEALGHASLFNAKMLVSSFQFNGQFISSNPAFKEVIGTDLLNLSQLIIEKDQLQAIYDDLNINNSFAGEILCRVGDQHCWFYANMHLLQSHDRKGKILLSLYSVQDRKIKEIAAQQESYRDALTGLFNRRGLLQKIDHYLESQTPFLLYYIDLDGFKLINDSFGHAGGDRILIWFAERLRQLDSAGQGCRFGGDEFIWLCPLSALAMPREQFSHNMLATLSQTYREEQGITIDIFASIGSATYPHDGRSAMDIISHADSAMYMSKLKGKNQITAYQQGMEQESKRKGLIAQHLSQAIQRQELSVRYQAIYDVTSNKLKAYEALLHWENEFLGNVPMKEALKVAKTTGLIQLIEGWVIDKALEDLPTLRANSHNNVGLSLNISGLHLATDNFANDLHSRIRAAGLKPEDIIVELTETTLLNDIDQQISSVQQLKELGIIISIDSFGIGLSSLAYLHKIPASIVKVDKQFLEGVLSNGAKTIDFIHQLVTSLGMTTLVEGVETEAQKEALLKIGVQLQQGSLYNGD